MAILEKEVDNEDQRELGPLKYLAETTGYDMNTVVNWFLLMIIFVFDPLAIALVVAANMAFAQIKSKEHVIKELYTDEDEKRINVIGQNGNDGLHYDQEEMIKKNEQILATVSTKEKSFDDLKNRIKGSQDELQKKTKEEQIYFLSVWSLLDSRLFATSLNHLPPRPFEAWPCLGRWTRRTGPSRERMALLRMGFDADPFFVAWRRFLLSV